MTTGGFGVVLVLAGVIGLRWERERVHIYEEEDFDV